jgi:branched-chain amino acid transport system ATP-binding protein
MSGRTLSDEMILEVRDVRRVFGGVIALGGISMEVPKGSIVGLIGPNGSGKTTLVNVISGMLRPTSGSVRLKGKKISGMPTHQIARMGLSRTFQVVRPFTNMTVLENVAVGAMFGGARGGRTARDSMRVARDVLEQVGLGTRADMPAETLTVMGRKRLELARALASEPDVLLLDEVLAGLRANELEDAINLIRGVSELGVTMVIIEHVLRVIVSLCDRVVVINRGQKIAEGLPDAVMADPAVIEAYLGRGTGIRHGTPNA